MGSEDYAIFVERRREKKERRARRLANTSDFGWEKHSETHWYRFIDGEKLHWWPSANKWLYKGKFYRGALPKSILERVDADDERIRGLG
jgi:hypothetical protein